MWPRRPRLGETEVNRFVEKHRFMPRRTPVPYGSIDPNYFSMVDTAPLVLQDWPERPDLLEGLLRRGARLPALDTLIWRCDDDQPRLNAAINRVLALPADTPGVREFARSTAVGWSAIVGPVITPGRRQRADSGEPHGLAIVMNTTLFETGRVAETIEYVFRHPEEVTGVIVATEHLFQDLGVAHDMIGPVGAVLLAMYTVWPTYGRLPDYNNGVTFVVQSHIYEHRDDVEVTRGQWGARAKEMYERLDSFVQVRR